MERFGFSPKKWYIMFRKLFGRVMGLIDKQKQIIKKEESPAPLFSKEELEILLRTISESNFKGKEVQIVYDLVYKLQQLYIK
jgi:hypothetical protein